MNVLTKSTNTSVMPMYLYISFAVTHSLLPCMSAAKGEDEGKNSETFTRTLMQTHIMVLLAPAMGAYVQMSGTSSSAMTMLAKIFVSTSCTAQASRMNSTVLGAEPKTGSKSEH